MSKKRKLLLGAAIFIVILIVAILAWSIITSVTSANERRGAYSFLRKTAEKRFHSVSLGKAKQGMTDCYPSDSNTVSCYAVVYALDKQACVKALEVLAGKADGADCSREYKTLSIDTEKVGVRVGPARQGSYELRLWLESKL